MAVSTLNYVFLALSLICAIPGCALMWRTFHASELIQGELYRQANYETCAFLAYWVLNAIAIFYLNKNVSVSIVRALSIGVLVYTTVLGVYTNFTNLNNLRIVDESNNKGYFFPISGNGPLDRVNQRKFFGGLILGWFSLLFGLFSTHSGFSFGKAGGTSSLLFFIGTIICIPGVVVSWSNSGTAGYPATATSVDQFALSAQNSLFQITTFTIVQWFVLAAGLFSAAEDLLASSAFIYGIGNLFAPVYYFYIQYQKPDDSNYVWAGPILCWIGCAVLAWSSFMATPVANKEAAV